MGGGAERDWDAGARRRQDEPLWDELFPAEQARIVRLLVARVDVDSDHISVRLRAEGLQTLVEQLRTTDAKAHAA